MSSPSSSTLSQCPRFYRMDQLAVQKELIQKIDNQYLPALQEVFRMPQWLDQNEPLDRETIKRFCFKDPVKKEFVCVFCPNASFSQSTKAVEHIQKEHFRLYPFDCENWWVCSSPPPCIYLMFAPSKETFLRKNELENHEKTHGPPAEIECPKNW